MTTEEKIIDLLRLPSGNYDMISCYDILKGRFLNDDRFLFMHGKFLSARENDNGEAELVFLYGFKDEFIAHPFPSDKSSFLGIILNEVEMLKSNKVYIIAKSKLTDTEMVKDTILLTLDRKKASTEYEALRNQVKKYADDNGYLFDEKDFDNGYSMAIAHEDDNFLGKHYQISLSTRNLA